MMIIGLNGRMQSGKDTVATILAENFNNIQRGAFARKLKQSGASALDISTEQLEDLKLNGTIIISGSDWTHEISGRQYLQYYGTEAHRDVFGDDFWVEQVLDKPVTDGHILVVTDMRFPNEISGVLDRGGIAVKIRRAEADNKPILHPSEQTLPDEQFDYFLDNNGSMAELHENVFRMVDWIIENRPQFRFEMKGALI
jgi:hypothetical protein